MPSVPPSFKGRLYFVLGPGLGDTVNGLRILHEVLAHYPNAEPVVYVDPRWEDLYACIPELRGCKLRHYSAAPSAVTQQQEQEKETPYRITFLSLLQEIVEECKKNSGLVALAGFKLGDRLARKESSLVTQARAIGLSLKLEECRPYLPLSKSVLAQALPFLQVKGLTPGHYFIAAPYTWLDKMWKLESWEILIDNLYKSTGQPTLIIGVHGYPSVYGPGVLEALDLPLPQVAALIAQSRCYIGLDTGPTHIAACFDIPIVALNPQGKYPPFLVEPNSPYRWVHLTPGVYGHDSIPVPSVFETACRALKSPNSPHCPVCAAQSYILGANENKILCLCPCGLMFCNQAGREREEQEKPLLSDPFQGTTIVLPTSLNELASFSAYVNHIKSRSKMVTISFDHWDTIEADPLTLLSDPKSCELWWNWDSVYAFLSRFGWQIIESHLQPATTTGHAIFLIEIKAVPFEIGVMDSALQIPWGRKIIHVRRSIYERWLAWGAFRNQDELEGLGWHLVNEGERNLGRFILKMALKIQPRWKGLRRFMLAVWASVGNHSINI